MCPITPEIQYNNRLGRMYIVYVYIYECVGRRITPEIQYNNRLGCMYIVYVYTYIYVWECVRLHLKYNIIIVHNQSRTLD